MAIGVYSCRTLNENWFEDRCQPPGSLTAIGPSQKKQARPYETDLAYIGERYDVLARVSRVPPRPTFALPDDGFNEKSKTSLVDFADPRTRGEWGKGRAYAPPLVNTENAPVRPPETRELPGTRSGFGGHLPRHEENHDQRFFNTTSGDFYGEGVRTKGPFVCPSTLRAAGTTTEEAEARTQGLRVGVLCGEAFNDSNNQGINTRTQRSWLYSPDASLRNIHLGGTRPRISTNDNELSLPLGEGAMSKIRADLKERQGRLFRTATHITKSSMSKSGIAIFADD